MEKRFAFIFSINNKPVWSGETEESLLKRADNQDELDEITEFVKTAKVGWLLPLEYAIITRTD